MKRLGQDAIDRPAALESRAQGLLWHTYFFGPIRDDQVSTLKLKSPVSPSISSLLKGCLPATIIRLIMSVIVFAANRVLARWHRPHIFQKLSKGFAPSIAHADSTRSVVFVFLVCWAIASLLSLYPYRVFSTLTSSVPRHACSDLFSVQASATLRLSWGLQAASLNDPECAALATAQPINMAASRWRLFDNRPASDRSSGQLNFLWHGRNTSIIEAGG